MTAHGNKVIVLAGEPSSAPRDPAELSMVYVLDTAKIRYPNDAPAPAQIASKNDPPLSPTRRPSNEVRNTPGVRSISREGQTAGPVMSRSGSAAREGPSSGPVRQPSEGSQPHASRLPRAASSGPPPQGQAPTPRMNGVVSPTSAPMNVPMTMPRGKPTTAPAEARGPPTGPDSVRSLPTETMTQVPTVREIMKENTRSSRESSPGSHGKRTPTQHQQAVSKAKAMEAGEAAPMITHNGVARQRSIRSQRGQNSIDASGDGILSRTGSGRQYSDTPGDTRSVRSIPDEPKSPGLGPHTEALAKELEASKKQNAWYAAELSLARKAGYQPGASSSPTFDERAVTQFGDDDRSMIELLMKMRAELGETQEKTDRQATETARRIAEVEHQRDASMREAAYARAKLAAHGGSQRSTPQPDSARGSDEIERSTDMSRRLALALASQNEHKVKLDALHNELESERRARSMAEESAEAAHARLEEINQGRNPAELEALRAELHEVQSSARAEAGRRAEVEERLRMLQVDHSEISQKHQHVATQLKEHISSLAALEAVIAASKEKADVFERQAEEEREQRETLERKLAQLRAELEDKSAEVESTTKRLRDAEQLADIHAKEAATHRDALMAGFARLSSPEPSDKRESAHEERVAALNESAERANALAKANQEAADRAAQKLRSAEERIAGLETYQDQSSREVLQIRKQLKSALQEVQMHQNAKHELIAQLENHQQDANALTVQHSALKELLGERGIDMSNARRSPNFDTSPGSRHSTPDQNRLRELEQQLQSSSDKHEETKRMYESREQDADRTYREKLEQLESDYQSAVHYVKGTEKMLKKMKEELTKYKTQNQQLKSELDEVNTRSESANSLDQSAWAAEREQLHADIDTIRMQMSGQVSILETRMAAVHKELAAAQIERDQQRSEHENVLRFTRQAEQELAQLKSENSMLETRALDAEHKVTMLLDQVGQSVGHYRRQSHLQQAQQQGPPSQHTGANGIGHARDISVSTATETSSHEDEVADDKRGSEALDNLANELETLRTQWESSTRNYRLSKEFDFEKTPTRETHGGELSDSLATWRKRLEDEERESPRSPDLASKILANKQAAI